MLQVKKRGEYSLLVDEVRDTLIQTLMWWYLEESKFEEEIPNLYHLLNDDHHYYGMVYEAFIESICWNRYRSGVSSSPGAEGFLLDDYKSASEELATCFEYYYPKICEDVVRIMKELCFVFEYYNVNTPLQSHVKSISSEVIDDYPLQEVW